MARIINREATAASESTTSFITTSGIYRMQLKGIELKETTNGAVQANYIFDKGRSYGNTIMSKDGRDLFGFSVIDALGIIEGLESYGNTPDELEELELTTKAGVTSTIMVIPELADIEVVAHIQYKYEMYNDQIQERVSVKRFYRPSDFATSTEIVEDQEPGTKHASDLEKYAETVIYADGVTAEDVVAWKEAQKSGGTATAPTQAATKAGFGAAKRGFGTPAKNQ